MERKTLISLAIIAIASLACLGEDVERRRYSNPPANPGGNESEFGAERDAPDYSFYDKRQRTRDPLTAPPTNLPETIDPERRTQWAVSSVLDSIEVVSDDSCCTNYDDDSLGLTDNAFGSLLIIAGMLESTNSDLRDAIGQGKTTVVFEHEGFDASGGAFTMNVARGIPSRRFVDADPDDDTPFQPNRDGSNPYVLHPRGISGDDAILSPMTASYEDGVLTASARTINVPFTLWGVSFDIDLHHVLITANVDEDSLTNIEGGIPLEDGTLGAILDPIDLYDAINDFVALECECLGVEGDIIAYPELRGEFVPECLHDFERDRVFGRCIETSTEPNMGCLVAPTFYCGNIGSVTFSLDQHLDEPSMNCLESDGIDCDGISVAIRFTAAGAVIEGIAE